MRAEYSKADAVKQFQIPTMNSCRNVPRTDWVLQEVYPRITALLTDLTRKNVPNLVRWTEEWDGAFN